MAPVQRFRGLVFNCGVRGGLQDEELGPVYYWAYSNFKGDGAMMT